MVVLPCIPKVYLTKIPPMKILSSLILSFTLIFLWSCSDGGNNPVSSETEDECALDLDCNDVCGGSAVEDCAGICGGSALLSDGNCTNISYAETIQPIFTANCSSCHIESTRNNLSLSNYSSITSGNSDDGPVIISGDHANSLLWEYVNSGFMPPSSNDLTASQIGLIATWIDEGALDN